MPERMLPIHNMAERHLGLTNAVAQSYTEAARVCLDRHHKSPVEVSGVDRGSPSAVNQRLKEKLVQALAGASNLPAMSGVVGFQARIIRLSRVERP